MGIIGLTVVRWLMLSLDFIVYSLVRVFYNLFFAISEIRLFAENSSLIETITTRIYALIGIYALFKVTFILINMLINPDAVNDKQKGAGKLIVRFIVMLALIIAVPWIFKQAYELQNRVLTENLVGKILLGDESDQSSSNIKDAGQKAANEIFASFVMIDEGAATYPTGTESVDDEPTIDKTECQDSYNAIKTLSVGGISSLFSHIGTTFKDSSGDQQFCIKYTFFVSLIAGGFAAYVFAVYCLDIGLRVAKLAFYELIAPIPIVTFVDGKKQGPFDKWLKSTVSTFLDLLIRLIIIYFIIFILNEGLPDLLKIESLKDYDFFTRNFAKAIVMLGLLMFAAQAPKLIKDLFGVKGDDNAFGMSLTQKLGKAAVVGGALSAGASFVGHSARAGASKVGSTVKNRGLQAVDAMRASMEKDPTKKADLQKKVAENYAIRQKAGSVQALSMLDSKNWDSKSHKYTGTRAGALARQALTGNVNAGTGITGRAQGKISELTASLSYETGAHKSFGLKAAGAIGARLANLKANLATDYTKYNEMAKTNPSYYDSQLKVRDSFEANGGAKTVFENYLRSVNIDPTFQNLPDLQDSTDMQAFVDKFMDFSKSGSFMSLTTLEKQAVQEYAEKALGDLKKEVDTLSKKK